MNFDIGEIGKISTPPPDAIDTARAVIQYGRYPEIHKLAEGIISAQKQEICQIKASQTKRQKKFIF